MEEVTSANQSAESIETTDTPIASETVETPVTTQETQPEGIRVKYNHEEKVISLDEAPSWIQKGLNYDKVQERATQLESQTKYLEKMARIEGFSSVDEYVKAIDEYDQRQQVQQEAERLGVPEDFIRSELQPLKGELEQLRQEREQIRAQEQQLRITSELNELRTKYNDFDSYNDKVFDLVTNKGYGLEDAYMVASFQDKIANTRKQAEAETIRNLQQNAESSTGALSQGDVDHKTGFANLSREEQRRMIAEVKQGIRKTFN